MESSVNSCISIWLSEPVCVCHIARLTEKGLRKVTI